MNGLALRLRTLAVTLAATAAVLASVPVAPAAAEGPAPASVIHPGDKLDVGVLGENDVSAKVVVRPDGAVDLPLAGSVRVAGSTPTGAALQIATALRAYVKNPQVTVAITQPGQINVLVLGNVKETGKFKLRSGARLGDAIAMAGGLDVTNGSYPAARVSLPDGTVRQIPLEALLRAGDESANIELSEGAAVYVPGQTQFEISMLGAVDHPGTIRINEGDRLSMAIAKAGNTVNATADLSRVMVTRTEADGRTESHEVDLLRAVQQGDSRYDPRLKKGDIVFVPVAPKKSGPLGVLAVLLRLMAL